MTKNEFDNKLDIAGISRKEFAELSKTSYGTVTKWNDIDRPVPSWVDSWIENYIKAKVSDNIIEAVKPFVGSN
jgi:hypothetical protein